MCVFTLLSERQSTWGASQRCVCACRVFSRIKFCMMSTCLQIRSLYETNFMPWKVSGRHVWLWWLHWVLIFISSKSTSAGIKRLCLRSCILIQVNWIVCVYVALIHNKCNPKSLWGACGIETEVPLVAKECNCGISPSLSHRKISDCQSESGDMELKFDCNIFRYYCEENYAILLYLSN